MDLAFGNTICHLMGFAILEWKAEGSFRATGQLPPWWSLLDEASATGDAPFEVDERFPFLENFLVDAHELWQNDSADRLGSGIWQHQRPNGTDIMLEAFAINTGSQNLMLIQNVTQSGTALELLQKGRGSQLELLRDLARRRQLELELRAGQEQAERLDKAKTEFVAHVSHEMRTPLTTILGMCELLSESKLDEQQASELKTLEESALSLLNVVHDLLDVARIEAGTITTHVEYFSPVTLVREVEKDYRPAASERGIELKVRLADNLPKEICSDANRIRQILNNLLDNAIKFTDHGAVTLAVDLFDKGPHPIIQFQVIDTGIGIDLDDDESVFHPFVQSESIAEQNEFGVGLGLSIARRLTEAIQGDISVTSTTGKGSIFSLALPTLPAKTSESELPRQDAAKITPTIDSPVTKSNSNDSGARSLRILVAEDNPVNRKFILQVLSKSGHEVVGAANGQEALDETEKNEFDLVLMDCQMPVLSGYDACTAIRERERTTGSHLPVVAVTAHAMEENRQKCLRVGMDLFVTKPFKTKELLEIVQHAATLCHRC